MNSCENYNIPTFILYFIIVFSIRIHKSLLQRNFLYSFHTPHLWVMLMRAKVRRTKINKIKFLKTLCFFFLFSYFPLDNNNFLSINIIFCIRSLIFFFPFFFCFFVFVSMNVFSQIIRSGIWWCCGFAVLHGYYFGRCYVYCWCG